MEAPILLHLEEFLLTVPMSALEGTRPMLPLLWAFAPFWAAYLMLRRSPGTKIAQERVLRHLRSRGRQ